PGAELREGGERGAGQPGLRLGVEGGEPVVDRGRGCAGGEHARGELGEGRPDVVGVAEVHAGLLVPFGRVQGAGGQREASASWTPRAAKAPAKERRIQARVRGRAAMKERTAAANTP